MEVKGLPGYLIYSDGRVWSNMRKNGKFLETFISRNGYEVVSLGPAKDRHKYLIHRLIAQHYIPNPENKREVDHINRNSLDNTIENLRWVSRSENNQNRGINRRNTSGFKFISLKFKRFERIINGKKIQKRSSNLSELLCYSFFYQLKYPEV
tara:strand:- start:165 stop:620 length:456 start_codon:yes stop_codon:yes gene_type:complete